MAGISASPSTHRIGNPDYRQFGERPLQIASARRILRSGEHLFHAGEPCTDAYLVCSGSLESYFVHADGEEQILGLHGVGEVVGFDALFGAPASTSIKAIDTTSLKVVRNPGRQLGLDQCDGEAREVIAAMLEEYRRFMQRLHMERHPSERRLAEFLLDFAERAGRRGLSTNHLMLPTSRRVLARYLGLAPETLSRTFSTLQNRAILEVDNREVTILDLAALQAIAKP
jgi:CRP/FNR family transcriptional regulator, anaerobic regulatory protein